MGTTDTRGHVPVLVSQVIQALAPRPGQVALDCTAGQGGHARAIAQQLGPTGTIILNDADPVCLAAGAQAVRSVPDGPGVVEVCGNFAHLPRKLIERSLSTDCVLADLGFSSTQMGDGARGLSFQRDGPLDMRYDPQGPTTAADLVNSLEEQELAEILRDFGEERRAGAIARKLVAERKTAPIETTGRLASIVRGVLGGRSPHSRIDPATRTFQALRIAVNDELGSLESLLESVMRSASGVAEAPSGGGVSLSWLGPEARIAVISFHSLEDRMVKRTFGELVRRGLGQLVSKKPVVADPDEVDRNPRSRSAKLRTIALGAE